MTLVTNETLFFTFREKELYEYLFFLFSSFVVQFSRYIRSPLSDSLLIIPQAFAFVKYFFKFFQLFFFYSTLFRSFLAVVVFGDLCIISQSFSFVKGFLNLFRSFFNFSSSQPSFQTSARFRRLR